MYIQPLYVQSLGANPAETGFTIGMWGLGRLLFILPAGILADRWGPNRILLPGWYAGLIGVLTIALAPDWRWAAPGFLIYGISAAAIPVTHLYIVQASRYDPTRRPDLPPQAALTLMWAAYSVGLVVTPGIGGLLGDWVGLRVVFLFSVFWFALSVLAIMRVSVYPAPEHDVSRRADYGTLLRQPVVAGAFGLIMLGFITIAVGQTLSPQFLEDARGFSRTWIGTFGSLNALGTAVFSLALARITPWRGFFASLLLVMLSFVLMLASGAWPVVVVAYFMLGAYNTARPLAVGVISNRVPEHQRGMAYALLDTLSGLAILVGTNVAGQLYEVAPEWPLIVGAVGLALVMVSGVWVLGQWPRRRRAIVLHVSRDPGASSGSPPAD